MQDSIYSRNSQGLSEFSSASKKARDKPFSNRFQGKLDFMNKDGHYGIVSNTKNPIQKGSQKDLINYNDKLTFKPDQIGGNSIQMGDSFGNNSYVQ